MKILLIESDEEVLYLYQTALSFQRLEVITARSGTEGLEIIKTEKINLIILDIMVPDLARIDFEAVFGNDSKKIPLIIIDDGVADRKILETVTRVGLDGSLSRQKNSLGEMIAVVLGIIKKKG